jgi:hypothetical protein
MASVGDAVVLFGGIGMGTRFLGDTWVWEGHAWAERAWRGPSPRAGHAMAALDGEVLLFGGKADDGEFRDDTWTASDGGWTRHIVAGPSPRFGHSMATLGSSVVLFGGWGLDGALGDTWTWNGARWTLHACAAPSPRGGHAMATLGDRVVLGCGLRRSRPQSRPSARYVGVGRTGLDTVGRRRTTREIRLVNGVVVVIRQSNTALAASVPGERRGDGSFAAR